MTDRTPITHDLKTWPGPFNLVAGGLKSFEIRKDDQGFAEGDHLLLHEWDPFGRYYTGRELTRRITCITREAGPLTLPEGLVVLGLSDLAAERRGVFFHQLAEALGVKPVFGAVEEEVLLREIARLKARAGEDDRLVQVLDLMREAHQHALRGTGPKTKACLGDATRLLAAVIDGRE